MSLDSAVQPPSIVQVAPLESSELDSPQPPIVIFLHGLGGSPENIAMNAVHPLRQNPAIGPGQVKWILPVAPTITVTGNMGRRMPAWFNIHIFDFPLTIPSPGEEDEATILPSIASIEALLTNIVDSGVDPSRIVLGGFSQGAAMTLLTGLTTSHKLAGLFVLSARLPLRHRFKSMASSHASAVPISWGHGTVDPLVPYKLGRVCADFLMIELGIPPAKPGSSSGLDFHAYEGLAHYIGDDELTDLASWLRNLFSL
ncbi:delta-sterol C-methyltransferase [Favolaschia claudopus]|uniref:Acyl-protein thioesterase 1 n=1 Tax=Favolaschia claudopus TaxID=2862362 RepID=A0AAW0AI71_9AGAR